VTTLGTPHCLLFFRCPEHAQTAWSGFWATRKFLTIVLVESCPFDLNLSFPPSFVNESKTLQPLLFRFLLIPSYLVTSNNPIVLVHVINDSLHVGKVEAPFHPFPFINLVNPMIQLKWTKLFYNLA
jgi:hypothetical protein